MPPGKLPVKLCRRLGCQTGDQSSEGGSEVRQGGGQAMPVLGRESGQHLGREKGGGGGCRKTGPGQQGGDGGEGRGEGGQ